VLAPLLVASLVAGALGWGWLTRLELLSQDLRYRLLPPSPPPPLLLVAIDDDSIKEAAVWPWPRGRYAEAIRLLDRAGARAVFFDLDFSSPGPDLSADEEFARAVGQAGKVALAMSLEERTTPEGFGVMSYALPLPASSAPTGRCGASLPRPPSRTGPTPRWGC
jgi:CHASE2 domain-containing sensor protein